MNRRDFLSNTSLAIAGFTGSMLLPNLSEASLSNSAYMLKMRNFNKHHKDDIFLAKSKLPLLNTSLKKMYRIQRIVGHSNFYLLNFDEAIAISKNYSKVGTFTKDELDFLAELFYADCSVYGFKGDKPMKSLTTKVHKRSVVKVRGTGNYLYKGMPEKLYKKIKKDIGEEMYLTSGVRSVMKQFLLFLNKVYKSEGNLSLASRSLAPPGYSYHGISDFDVGKVGLGSANFTDKFAQTDLFKKLLELDYVSLRYPKGNNLGVRYEPWHITVKESYL
ncbi:MAG: D-alanyl-D-alanine carboxypeptidase family protein [Nitrospinae bacterium]|nr:D-alanyl-D-alanine carboxypeptidase family protein [Nitrospinota bacterium]